jgi:multidrug efflux pump subunit AcrB
MTFPGVSFFFQPADIVSQVLNFGLPSPIDIQVVGRDQEANYQIANDIAEELRHIPGAVDVHVQQMFDQPSLQVKTRPDESAGGRIHRAGRGGQPAGRPEREFSNCAVVLPESRNGVSYQVASQVPQYNLDSLQTPGGIPVTGPSGAVPQLLGNLATIFARHGTRTW